MNFLTYSKKIALVEVYIKNLRKKIDTPFPGKKPLLTTIRGFGYKLG